MSHKNKKIILQFKARRKLLQATRNFFADIQTITNTFGGRNDQSS
jgi:hypothetical protein